MDTSKEYVEMCEMAVEIQPTIDKRKHFYCPRNFYYDAGRVWLPRQDQLQEMVSDKKTSWQLSQDFWNHIWTKENVGWRGLGA